MFSPVQADYVTHIIVLPSENSDQTLKLNYYLLLVHTSDQFPRLTRDSPDLRPTCHALPTGLLGADPDFEESNKESELNIKVREHRRKMGFGSLTTPSLASQIVLNQFLIEEHMRGVKGHLHKVGQDALCHMRRDVLWKRLLYGQLRPQYETPSTASVSVWGGCSQWSNQCVSVWGALSGSVCVSIQAIVSEQALPSSSHIHTPLILSCPHSPHPLVPTGTVRRFNLL